MNVADNCTIHNPAQVPSAQVPSEGVLQLPVSRRGGTLSGRAEVDPALIGQTLDRLVDGLKG